MSIPEPILRGGGDPTTEWQPSIREGVDSIGASDLAGATPSHTGRSAIKARLVSRRLLRDLQDRPAWHEISTPEPVAAAWDAIAPLLERLDKLAALERSFDAEDQAQTAAAERAARSAIEAGEPVPKVKPADRTDQLATLQAEATAVVGVLRAKRAEYNAAVTEALPAWREAIIAAHTAARPMVAEAWGAFTAAFSHEQTFAGTLAKMNKAIDPEWGIPRSTAADSVLDGTKKSLGQLTALVHSEDPIVTGEVFHQPVGIRPTYAERYDMVLAAQQQMGPGAPIPKIARDLFTIEQAEDFQVTDFTKGLADHLTPTS